MKNVFISFLICIFCLWLMPLTALVKPSQDKLICDGQRAICLCRDKPSAVSVQLSASAGVALQSGQVQTEKESSGGLPPQFLVKNRFDGCASLRQSNTLSEDHFLYSFRFIPTFEHVPKAA